MKIESAQATVQRHLCVVSHGCRKNDGQSRVNYEIIMEVLKRGWQVTFIGSYLAEELSNEPSLRWLKVARRRLPSNLLKNLIFALQATLVLREHKAEFDLIHTNGFIIWSRSDINTIHFVHTGWARSRFYPYKPFKSFYGSYQYFFTWLNALLERYAFKASRQLVAVSKKVKEEIEFTGFREAKLTVIHNGVDLEEFYPGKANRAMFSLPQKPVLFLFAGDIRTPRKNLGSVIEALCQVPQAHLVVAGRLEGSPYPTLAKTLGVESRIHFLGLVVNMPDLMRSVDVFVFPSRYEACSLAILEALASGLPVITAITAGGAEVIGKGGIVIADPDDVQLLAKSMEYLATDMGARSKMSEKARQVSEQLSWSRMTQHYFELYDKYLT